MCEAWEEILMQMDSRLTKFVQVTCLSLLRSEECLVLIHPCKVHEKNQCHLKKAKIRFSFIWFGLTSGCFLKEKGLSSH